MGRTPENYMQDPVTETTKYEDEAWEAGYLQALNHAVQLTDDEQLKDMLKEMTIRFAVNNATRWE